MEPQQGSDQTPPTLAASTDTPSVTPAPTPTAPATPVSTPTPSTTPQPSQPTDDTNAKPTAPSSTGKSKAMPIMLGIVLLIVIITGVLFVMQRKTPAPQPVVAKKVMESPTPAAQTTPVITPVTSANVNQTLNNTDSTMQKAVSQANTDLNSISSINTSQDSTSGL